MTTTHTILTAETTPYGSVSAPLVVLDGWAHSTCEDYAAGTCTASVRRHDETGRIVERHPSLDRAVYPLGSDEPRRLAYNAGILGYFVKDGAK